jgi:hypothetical protein
MELWHKLHIKTLLISPLEVPTSSDTNISCKRKQQPLKHNFCHHQQQQQQHNIISIIVVISEQHLVVEQTRYVKLSSFYA